MVRSHAAFTLLELLVVVAIMGIMATASVTSYRSMRQGMQDSAVVRNASQFVWLAYERSRIDMVPVNVYFWNETRKGETDDEQITVVGRATAVRRQGRVTAIHGQLLIDEFGDLDVFGTTDDKGNLDTGSMAYQQDAGMYLYRINGNEKNFNSRSLVSRTTGPYTANAVQMISYPDSSEKSITSYGFYVQDGSAGQWKKGDAYGLEFGDFELPNRYIFGSDFSSTESSPIRELEVFNFNPLSGDSGGQTLDIAAIRPNAQGAPTAISVGSTTKPSEYMRNSD